MLLQPQPPQSAYLTSFREVKYLCLNVTQAPRARVELECTPAERPLVSIESERFWIKTFHNVSLAAYAAQSQCHNYCELSFILSPTHHCPCAVL